MKKALAAMKNTQLRDILTTFWTIAASETPVIFKTNTNRYFYRFRDAEKATMGTRCTERDTAIPKGAEVCVTPGKYVAHNQMQKKLFVNVEYALDVNGNREKRRGWIVVADWGRAEVNQHLKKIGNGNDPKPCKLATTLQL